MSDLDVPTAGSPILLLASASPARRRLLLDAGLDQTRLRVEVSDVDEDLMTERLGPHPVNELVVELAKAKAESVQRRLPQTRDLVIIGCDSMLELDGRAWGKPRDAAEVRSRWATMARQSGILHTGQALLHPDTGFQTAACSSTVVRFGSPTAEELDAYIASEEPLRVAGAFTLDGLGAAFIDSIDGEASGVIGLSLPLLRKMLADSGFRWSDFWR